MEFAKIKFKINKINGSYVNIIKFLYWTKLQVKSVINTACQSYVLLYLPRDRSGVKKLTYEDYSKSPGIFGD